MRISSLIAMGKEYLLSGVIGISIVIVLALVVYKFLLKGKKKIKPLRIFGWLLLGSYIVIVLGATLLARSEAWEAGSILPLFYSYRDAWVNFSAAAWRNIILNVCMFVPLGLLLPMMIKSFRSFWKTYLVGFLFTLCIEGIQLLGRRGIFELDDILHNTVGMMIGYGIYAVAAAAIQKYRKEKVSLRNVLLLQLPLVVCVISFYVIFISYHTKELGNVGGQYIVTYDTDKLQVETDKDYDKKSKELPVYQFEVMSEAEASDFAGQLFQKLGTELDEERNDFYEDIALFHAKDSYNLWVNYAGGTYNLTDMDTQFSADEKLKTGASEEEVRKIFEEYGIDIPQEAAFSEKEGKYTFTVNQLVENGVMLDGEINGELNEENKFLDINYGLKKCKFYKSFQGISEREAYEQICSGKFFYPYGREEELSVLVKDCKTVYERDSKGYYQPVYLFSCEINGEESEIKNPILQ